MGKTRNGIVVAGSLMADVHYEIDTYPSQGMLSTIRGMSSAIGGCGNLILDLAMLDDRLPVQVSALVGRDAHGEMIRQALSRYPNIDTRNMGSVEHSSVTIVMNAKDTRQRTFFFLPGASNLYEEGCIDWDRLSGSIFHLEYLLLMKKVDAPDATYGTHGARILHDARRHGMTTSIDVVSEQGGRAQTVVRSALRYTDICSINEVEAQAVTGVPLVQDGAILEKNIPKALRTLRGAGVAKWAIIHSPKCSWGLNCTTGVQASVPSLSLPPGYIKGTTGAGDAYCSGILYGAHSGQQLEEAMRFATACAACSLCANNGTDGMRPTRQVLELEKELQRG